MPPNPSSTFAVEDPSSILFPEEPPSSSACDDCHHESTIVSSKPASASAEPISPPAINLKMRLTQSEPSLDKLQAPTFSASVVGSLAMSRSSSGASLYSMANTATEQSQSHKLPRRRSYSDGAGLPRCSSNFEPYLDDPSSKAKPPPSPPHSPIHSASTRDEHLSRPILHTPSKSKQQKQQQQFDRDNETPMSPVGRQIQKMRSSFRKTKQRTARALQKYKRERAIRRQERILQRQFIIQQRQKKLEEEQKKSKWLIPADHPIKVFWDVCTVFISFLGAYLTHTSIRDRTIEQTFWIRFTEAWFAVDILLNFVTQHKTASGKIIADGKAVWARYLTTWFVVDVLSLVPWESIYVKPIWEMQKRRGFFKKTFFRSKAVIRVTRVLRGRHFKLFGKVAAQTKHAGVGSKRLLQIMIKYIPKYLLFYRNMKGVLAVRTLRQVHWTRKVIKNLFVTTRTDEDKPLIWIVPALKKNHRHHIYKADRYDADDDTFTETDLDDEDETNFDDDDDDDDDDEMSFEFIEEEYDENDDYDDNLDTDDDDDDDDDEDVEYVYEIVRVKRKRKRA
mmetsp:Transcript_3138/g.4501  ORF Transcript_3138/g.4501 Transcript_3138/m.4501 type:complete len:563 (-) Transcript_3138:148-1836(-)